MIETIVHIYRRLSGNTTRFIDTVNHTSDRKLLCLLFLCFAVWRFLTIDLIEASGDAIWKWRFLRYFTELGEWFPTGIEHHQGRWGMNIPVLGIMKLFGTDPWVACIYPLVIAFICGLLIYLITRRIASRFAACSAYLIFLLLPHTVRESTQFLPMLPATCFILLAIWLILRYLEQPEKTFLLFLSGLSVGFSYGCKFTSLYWALAFALFLSLHMDPTCRWRLWKFHLNRQFILFSSGVFLILILETICLNAWFGISYGRVQMIMSGHLHNRPSPQYMGLAEYLFSFLRPLDLKGKFVEIFPYACILLGGIFVVCLWLKKQKTAFKLLTFSFITVYLLHSYIVYKVFPFLHPERSHGRYFLVLLTLCIIFVSAGWNDAVSFLKRYLKAPWLQLLFAAYLISLFIVMFIFAGNKWHNGENLPALIHAQQNVSRFRSNPQLPVIYQLSEPKRIRTKGALLNSDKKSISRWSTLFNPPQALSSFPFPDQFFTDEQQQIYIGLLNAETIRPGKPTDVIILQQEDSGFRTITLQHSSFRPTFESRFSSGRSRQAKTPVYNK